MARKNKKGRPRPQTQNRPPSGKSCTYYDKPRYTHVNKYADQKGRTKAKPYVEDMDDTSEIFISTDTTENQAEGTVAAGAQPYIRTSKKMFESLRRAPLRWEVWFAELGDHYGTSVQSGCRPVIIFSNNVSNRLSNTVTVVPMTTKRKHLELPSHVCVESEDCVPLTNETLNASMTLVEQITTVDKTNLLNLVCRIDSDTARRKIEDAVLYYIGVAQRWSGDEMPVCSDTADGGHSIPDDSIPEDPIPSDPIPEDHIAVNHTSVTGQEVQHGS